MGTILLPFSAVNNFILIFSYLVYVFLAFKSKVHIYSVLFVCSILISLLINVSYLDSTKELTRILFLSLCIAFFPLSVNVKHISSKLVFATIIILISFQIGIGNKVAFFVDFQNKYYYDEILAKGFSSLGYFDENNVSVSQLFSIYRFGGLHYNVNVTGQYFVFLFCLLLMIESSEEKYKLTIIAAMICFLGILLTGGRTSLIVFLSIVIYKTHNKIKQYPTFYFFGGLFILYLFFSTDYFSIFSDARSFDIASDIGDKDSAFGLRIAMLLNSIDILSDNYISFLIGNLWNGSILLETEITTMIYAFGIIGFSFYIIWLYHFHSKVNKNFIYINFILLFIISQTILFNFRVMIFYFLLMSIAVNKEVIVEPTTKLNTH